MSCAVYLLAVQSKKKENRIFENLKKVDIGANLRCNFS